MTEKELFIIRDELVKQCNIEIEEYYKPHERRQTLDSETNHIEKKYHKKLVELIEKYKKEKNNE